MDRALKEQLVRVRLSHLGFDLERELGALDWIVGDGREGRDCMKAVPPTRCQELDTISEVPVTLAGVLGLPFSPAEVMLDRALTRGSLIILGADLRE